MNLRKLRGLTQRQIAESIGVTDQTVSNWERGLNTPALSPAKMLRLCSLLKVNLAKLAEMFPDGE